MAICAEKKGSDEQGVIFDIKRYAIHDGPGIRTTVFFKGCPLTCRWCHNPESWSARPELGVRSARCVRCGKCVSVCPSGAVSFIDGAPLTDLDKCTLCGRCVGACVYDVRRIIGRKITAARLMAELEKDVIFFDQSAGGVTFSGGEPLMQPEFLGCVLGMCRQSRIHTAVDTTCYASPEVLQEISGNTDLFLCDVKHTDTAMHERFTGVPNELILQNIRYLTSAGKKVIVRFPLIPGFNDDDATVKNIGEFAASLAGVDRIDILPYHGGGSEKTAGLTRNYPIMKALPVPSERIEKIADILGGFGFKITIGG